jgi:hypothetical protein
MYAPEKMDGITFHNLEVRGGNKCGKIVYL